jgi:hypothetical protein
MPRLPDRFDLTVRKARQCPDADRQTDFILGALAALSDWYFLSNGSSQNPLPAETELEGSRYLVVFSDPSHLEELSDPPPLADTISIPTAGAMAWCAEQQAGILLNPGEDSALIPPARFAAFHAEWSRRVSTQPAGFWIPNMTTEEEDFWQEHGL